MFRGRSRFDRVSQFNLTAGDGKLDSAAGRGDISDPPIVHAVTRDLQMLDFLKWAGRARAFVRGLAGVPGKVELNDAVEPPGKHDRDKRKWLRSGQCSLPPEIHRFVESASVRCTFAYCWTPPATWLPRMQAHLSNGDLVIGGADLCEANGYYLYDGRHEFRSVFESLPLPGGLADHFISTNDRGRFLPLASLDNDRKLVLELESADGNRGVGCFSETDRPEFHRLNISFEMFLTHWEAVCYVTPDPDSLKPWLDPVTGLLNPDPGRARAFRELLREAANA